MTSFTLTRQVSASFSKALRRDASGRAPDVALAQRQHAAYCDALRELGLSVEVLSPLDTCPDACFVEDRVISVAGRALITRSALASRRGEAETLFRHLNARIACSMMDPDGDASLDGGDVIVLEELVLVGLSERTNRAGLECLEAWVRDLPLSLRVQPLVVDSALHLKCHASPLGPRTLLCAASWPHQAALPKGIERVCIPDEEAYAANVVAVEGAVIVAAGFPRTAEALKATGRRVLIVDTSAFRCADGSLTCLSVAIDAR